MTPLDSRICAVTVTFLRGEDSVPDYASDFRGAMNAVAANLPLAGQEVVLFYALEEWETAGWDDRPDVVDRLRTLARSAIRSG